MAADVTPWRSLKLEQKVFQKAFFRDSRRVSLKTLQLGDGMLFCLPEVVGVRFRRQVKALKYWVSAW